MKDDGAPGVRAHYHPAYYAAFVRDADGHSVEVVCHHDRKAAAPKKRKKAASRRR